MSQESPSSSGTRPSNSAGLIEWYDSPKIFLSSQAKSLANSRLLKCRSAEDFSPSRSLLTGTPSTSDFDSLWCGTSPQEDFKSSGGELLLSFVKCSIFPVTPRRSQVNKLLMRRRRLRTAEQLSVDEVKTPTFEKKCLSMEEGLAIGKASLVKLRQRLNGELDSTGIEKPKLNNSGSHHLKAIQPCSPNISPISSHSSSKKNIDTVLTPSMARSLPQSYYLTSTPKSTSFKRYLTMDGGTVSDEGIIRKVPRTKSLNVAEEGSDDDSFLNDIFVPFTHPSQYVEMLKQGSAKR
ncbi:hypothetical protein KIN20_000370 [Parelaphostrongylus tenuis]|uniref:Uncharacterized protein n=1 Tax=Parelaphostrongylus tenuis TaxID=148309 RepID=A0AAD5QBG1_PARTN|nr:hypothetical protein KIN20_000370 [Parelaphostrongylus tenuis]